MQDLQTMGTTGGQANGKNQHERTLQPSGVGRFAFWKGRIILHMIDECTRFSMVAIVPTKNAEDLRRTLRMWWCKIFQPPPVLLVDQEGSLGSDEAGRYLTKMGMDPKPKPTDLHATTVERQNALVRALLHNIEGQTTPEGLAATDEDIVSETCYAKNNMLEIGGAHPITAVL